MITETFNGKSGGNEPLLAELDIQLGRKLFEKENTLVGECRSCY